MSAAESPLDQALREREATQAAQKAAAQRMTEPAPDDPELDALFIDFAQRMSGRKALVFVKAQPVNEVVRHRAGFLGTRAWSETTQRVVTREVGRGWIVLHGQTFTLTYEPESHARGDLTVTATRCLAVTTDGKPLIVAATEGGGLLYGSAPVPDHSGHRPYVGPPLGPSLRGAITRELILDHLRWDDVEKEYLNNPPAVGRSFRAKTDGHEQLLKRISEGMAALLSS